MDAQGKFVLVSGIIVLLFVFLFLRAIYLQSEEFDTKAEKCSIACQDNKYMRAEGACFCKQNGKWVQQ